MCPIIEYSCMTCGKHIEHITTLELDLPKCEECGACDWERVWSGSKIYHDYRGRGWTKQKLSSTDHNE